MRVSLQNKRGLTLLEVLIALAILSIALTAIIKSTTQNIRHTLYLQNRTIATWVGVDVINKIRSGVLPLSIASDSLTQESQTLGQAWIWQATLATTPNPHIKKIEVLVYQKINTQQLAHLTSYLYVYP